MATAVHLPPPDTPAPLNEANMGHVSPKEYSHSNSYSQRLSLNDIDFRDGRYPTLNHPNSPSSPVALPRGSDPAVDAGMTAALRASYDRATSPGLPPPGKSWLGENITQEPVDDWDPSQSTTSGSVLKAQFESPGAEDEVTRSSGEPPVEPYSLDELPTQGALKDQAEDPEGVLPDLDPRSPSTGQWSSSGRILGDQYDPTAILSSLNMVSPGAGPSSPLLSPALASSPRHPSLPAAGIGAGPSPSGLSPIVPLSAGPTYNPTMQIPISPKPKAYAQHPTYITQTAAPALQPSFSPAQVPKEEVCVECTMRDQDMADVDVTGPGVWDRESDVLYEELCRREAEEDTTGHASSDSHSRPRARGGLLTEENLKCWLSFNPKESSSRQQTLDQYVKLQRSLIEADALARARALRESRLLDDKMRDTFSQLRRSAYELGNIAQPTDETGALRIRSPRIASFNSNAAQSHPREVTLLENGMIVEHVDLRKEEKESREQRRKNEKREKQELSRARKSSRSSRSGVDVASVRSMPLASPMPPLDSGFFSNPRDSQHSQTFSPRPSSVLTGGGDRPQTLLRAQSQASFSDMQSLSSASPRRSRFFGFKNLSAAWQSRDSMAPSGSMIDMHLALQQEQQYFAAHPSAVDLNSNTPTVRAAQSWPRAVASPEPMTLSITSTTKKKNGLKKIWKLVTGYRGSAKGVSQSRSVDRHEDDMPLAPPPPLSYLVEREGAPGSRRHLSTPSLLSSISPNQLSQWAPSPPTAPSSALPSPTSSRYPIPEREPSGEHQKEPVQDVVPEHRISAFELGTSNEQDVDGRGRTTHSSSRTLSSLGPVTPGPSPSNRPQSSEIVVRRDKSLPPLPGESAVEFPRQPMPDARPQTMYDLLQTPVMPVARGLAPPQAPFRTPEARRQSFGGLASIPHPAVQSLPGRSPYPRGPVNVPPFLAEEKYAEFGASSPSLSWGNAPRNTRSLTRPLKPKQRRSRFGLASLFGKKPVDEERDSPMFSNGYAITSVDPLDYNPYRSSASDQREHSWNGPGNDGPGSAHSSNAPRMSIVSKKNIAELVDQDPEFVAYRYPSSDQRLDVLR